MRSPTSRDLPGADQDRFADLPDGTRICYRVDGDVDAPTVLLIGGLAEDITSWSPVFVARLVERGMRVI